MTVRNVGPEEGWEAKRPNPEKQYSKNGPHLSRQDRKPSIRANLSVVRAVPSLLGGCPIVAQADTRTNKWLVVYLQRHYIATIACQHGSLEFMNT